MSSSNKKTHFKDLSSFSIAAKNTIYEDDEKNDKGNNECPSQFEVENILKENDFGNEEEIGKQYRKYIEEEEYEKDGLLEDLRDPDGSWLVDSELKPLFEWNDDQSNQFKKLLLRLMVEKKQEIKIRDRHKSFVKSLLKKSQSKAFLDLYKKNEVLLSKNIEQTKSDIQMPTYINRAIWFRSDDENLERLIDQAVKEVILLESIWNDTEFINNIYSNDRFDICVEQIFKLKFRFF